MRTKAYLVLAFLVVISLFAWAAYPGAPTAGAADNPLVPVTHQPFNGVVGVLTQGGDGTVGENVFRNPPSPICSTTSSSAANVNTDCEGTAPHNETSIAVNPRNAQNMIGSNNDYQLRVSSGGTINETVYSRAHVTFDGGHTWTT